jgi:hypothetical protein
VDKENDDQALCRFLIGVDELRARLAPSRYPNIEIADEGYLRFSIDASAGSVEVLIFPFGFKEFKEMSVAVSLPRGIEDVNSKLTDELRKIRDSIKGAKTIIGFCTHEEIMNSYEHNTHPPLALFWNSDKMLEIRKRTDFLSYFGILFSIADMTAAEVESTVRDTLSKLNEE